jgi:Domain of unknown function (DUF6980)
MSAQLSWHCDHHPHPQECPDALVGYFPGSGRFGLYVHDGGSSFVEIQFCPWCGYRLAESELTTGQFKLNLPDDL